MCGHTLRPVQDNLLQARVFRLELLQPPDDGCRGPDQPRLLANALFDGRHAGGGARSAPGSTLLVRVAHETKRGEPLVALVVVGAHALDAFVYLRSEIQPAAPGQGFAWQQVAADPGCVFAEL